MRWSVVADPHLVGGMFPGLLRQATLAWLPPSAHCVWPQPEPLMAVGCAALVQQPAGSNSQQSTDWNFALGHLMHHLHCRDATRCRFPHFQAIAGTTQQSTVWCRQFYGFRVSVQVEADSVVRPGFKNTALWDPRNFNLHLAKLPLTRFVCLQGAFMC